ncbi:hypothetical protein LINPERPRIM_LOCUS21427 [Linum perenne]
METNYLQDPSQCGNVLKGFEGFLSSTKNTALYAAVTVCIIIVSASKFFFCLSLYTIFISMLNSSSMAYFLCSYFYGHMKHEHEHKHKPELNKTLT